MEKEFKKSAVDLTDLALGIIVLGIVVSIGAVLLLGIRDSRLTDLSTFSTTNESTFINQTTDKLANTWGKSVDACYGDGNQSGNPAVLGNTPSGWVKITATNYTATTSDSTGLITLQNATATTYPNATCTYTCYNTTRADWTVADKAAIGLAEYGNWFKIIVIVGIAALVLSLIFMAFGNRNQPGSQVY